MAPRNFPQNIGGEKHLGQTASAAVITANKQSSGIMALIMVAPWLNLLSLLSQFTMVVAIWELSVATGASKADH
jgi:hypothetical protein